MSQPSPSPSALSTFIGSRWAIVLVIVVGGLLTWWLLISTPKPKAKPPQTSAPIVDVVEVYQGNHTPSWHGGGQVQAAEEVTIAAEIDGVISWLNPEAIPGTTLPNAAILARIDSQDYQLKLDIANTELAKAEAELDIEMGQQLLAKEELGLLDTPLAKEEQKLILREPQLQVAKAEVAAKQAERRQAQRDVARVEIKLPFPGQLLQRHIATGSRVAPGTPLFSAVNTNAFWIEVKIPRHFLSLLDKQAAAQIHLSSWPQNTTREAKVREVLAIVDSADRQAKVILQVDDPLSIENTQQPLILVNDFVEVVIQGHPIANTYALSPGWIYQNSYVWVVDQDNQLQQRPVDTRFQGREQSLVTLQIADGERIVTSRMDYAVNGMLVSPNNVPNPHAVEGDNK